MKTNKKDGSTHKKTGENRQTKKVGAHKKKERKKKKSAKAKPLFNVAKKKKNEKKGGKKRVSDVVSSLAWKCHEFVAQISASFFLGAFCLVFFPLFFRI